MADLYNFPKIKYDNFDIMGDNFFMVAAGAAATLTGLIFIGVSINLKTILSIPHLPFRAWGAMMIMASVLVISLLCLVPGQSNKLKGGENLSIGLIVWMTMTWREIRMWQTMDKKFKIYFFQDLLLTQLSTVFYLLSGTMFIFENGLSALYWLVPAFIFSFVKVISDSWVLLVEINR